VSVRKLKPKEAPPVDAPRGIEKVCYLCDAPADDNLVGVAHMNLCDFDRAVATGEEHWAKEPVCTKCFVKVRGAVFATTAMKKSS